MSCCSCSRSGFFFQAEDGIRYLVRSRGLGDVYKRQDVDGCEHHVHMDIDGLAHPAAAIPDKDHSATANSLSLIHI